VGGCQTTPPATLADVPPEDFALGVTVTPGADAPRRYVLDADGTLRASTGRGVTAQTLPPAVRRLDARTRERLWALARESYVLDPGNPYRADASALYGPAPGASVALVDVTASGVRRAAALDLAGEAGPFVRPLLDELAALTWQEPVPTPTSTSSPQP
jgi:hypothetical protein